jgi:hypothetical protein
MPEFLDDESKLFSWQITTPRAMMSASILPALGQTRFLVAFCSQCVTKILGSLTSAVGRGRTSRGRQSTSPSAASNEEKEKSDLQYD